MVARPEDGTPPEREPSSDAPIRTVTSEELLQGGTEVVIRHAGETYRLRRTSKGKLILTK